MGYITGTFVRQDLLTLERGVVVRYFLDGTGYNILTSRHGVQMQGTSPTFPPGAMVVVMAMIARATRQSEQLAVTPIGEPQTPIPESEFDAMEACLANPAGPHTARVDAPSAPDVPEPPVGPRRIVLAH